MFPIIARAMWPATIAGLLAVIAGGPSSMAQEFFAAPRDFVIDKACDATRSIKSRNDPVPLEAGKSYTGRGLNRSGGATHAFIRVGETNRWVDLSCGHFADGAGIGAAGGVDAGGATGQACLPFFDTAANPVQVGFGGLADITPEPPQLDAFDKALAETCGAPGKEVAKDEFVAMMRANPDVLERVRTFTSGKVFADRAAHTAAEPYLADLAEAWFAIKAFDHIFCGEPSAGASGGKIGGLHFHGRYLQLQNSGDACRMSNFRQNEVVPGVIYTFGVLMKNASGRMVPDARKGYGLTLSGEDILKVATRAFSENGTASAESEGCLLPVHDDGHDFTTVFVRRNAGIRTFYPDATPNAQSNRKNPACAAGIGLQD